MLGPVCCRVLFFPWVWEGVGVGAAAGVFHERRVAPVSGSSDSNAFYFPVAWLPFITSLFVFL